MFALYLTLYSLLSIWLLWYIYFRNFHFIQTPHLKKVSKKNLKTLPQAFLVDNIMIESVGVNYAAIGLSHEVVSVDPGHKKHSGHAIDNEQKRRRYLDKPELTNEEIATAVAHQDIYKKMIAENLQIVVIFDKNTQFIPDFKKRLLRILNYDLPDDWDIVKIGYSIPDEEDGKSYTNEKGHKVLLGTKEVSNAYLVSLDGAKKLAMSSENIWLTSDELLQSQNENFPNVLSLKSFFIEPTLTKI